FGCGVEVTQGDEQGGGGAGLVTATDGGAGGEGGHGGAAPLDCTPGDVCREVADVCDAPEFFDDACECIRDSPAGLGAEPTGDGCGSDLCDGHHFGCPPA